VPIAQLHSVHRLTVSYLDPKIDEVIKVVENVDAIRSVNKTAVTFVMGGKDLKNVWVWNGDAYAELADGTETPLCKADAECSALMVKDAEAADKFLEEARTELEKAGFDASLVEETALRRRLQRTEGCDLCESANADSSEEETRKKKKKHRKCPSQRPTVLATDPVDRTVTSFPAVEALIGGSFTDAVYKRRLDERIATLPAVAASDALNMVKFLD